MPTCYACGIETEFDDPCVECNELMNEGVIFVRVHFDKEGEMHRTGQMAVVEYEEAIDNPDKVNQILKDRVAYIPIDTWDMLGLPVPHLDQESIGGV